MDLSSDGIVSRESVTITRLNMVGQLVLQCLSVGCTKKGHHFVGSGYSNIQAGLSGGGPGA